MVKLVETDLKIKREELFTEMAKRAIGKIKSLHGSAL